MEEKNREKIEIFLRLFCKDVKVYKRDVWIAKTVIQNKLVTIVLYSSQDTYTFDMMGLWEKVETSEALHFVIFPVGGFFEKILDISCLGVHVAGDVDDLGRTIFC